MGCCTLSSVTSQSTSAACRSEEHTSELQSPCNLVCRLLLEKKKNEHYAISLHESSTSTQTTCLYVATAFASQQSVQPEPSGAHHYSRARRNAVSLAPA